MRGCQDSPAKTVPKSGQPSGLGTPALRCIASDRRARRHESRRFALPTSGPRRLKGGLMSDLTPTPNSTAPFPSLTRTGTAGAKSGNR
jgi:hypothetical protein